MRDRPQIRIAIADSLPLFLDGLEQLLRNEAGLLVVGRFTSGREAADGIERLRPHVALVDLRLKSGNGIWVIGEMRRREVPTRVVILATEVTEHDVTGAFRLGAKGVLLKETQPELILRCIREVHAGAEWRQTQPCAVCALSRRAAEVATLAAAGYRNREIGEKLFITEGTVKGHLNRIYERLGVRHRLGLERAVRACGMLLPEEPPP
jgi:DNA-binding NarL/FixJ family response regulator